MKIIPIIKWPKTYECFVDDADYNKVIQVLKPGWRWHFTLGYAAASCLVDNKYKFTMMHRIVLDLADSCLRVDHINHNRLDNRRENLRIASRKENLANMHKSTKRNYTSIYKGVSKREGSVKWRATIRNNNKTIYLGYYLTEIEAALAYDFMATKLFGKFACLNTYAENIAV